MILTGRAYDAKGNIIERKGETDWTMKEVEDWSPEEVLKLDSSSFDGSVFGLFCEDLMYALADGAAYVEVLRPDKLEQQAAPPERYVAGQLLIPRNMKLPANSREARITFARSQKLNAMVHHHGPEGVTIAKKGGIYRYEKQVVDNDWEVV